MNVFPILNCPAHNRQIEFIDLNKGVLLARRALCKECKLINPTELTAGLQIWNNYKQAQLQQSESNHQLINQPFKELQKQYHAIKKQITSLLEGVEKLLVDIELSILHQSTQQLEQIRNYDTILTLSKLQNIAAIISSQSLIGDGRIKLSPEVIIRQHTQQLKQSITSVNTEILEVNKLIDKLLLTFKIPQEKEKISTKLVGYKIVNSVFQDEVCKAIAIKPDNSILITGCNESIKVWEFDNIKEMKQLSKFKAHSQYITCLCYSKLKDLFVSGSKDGSIKIWIMETKEKWIPKDLKQEHKQGINCLLLNHMDDQIISGSEDKTLNIWNRSLNNQQWELGQKLTNHTDQITDLSLNVTESQMITCDGNSTLIIWEITKGRQWVLKQQIKDKRIYGRATFIDCHNIAFLANDDGLKFSRILVQDSKGEFQVSDKHKIKLSNTDESSKLFPSIFNQIRGVFLMKLNKYIYLISQQLEENSHYQQVIECDHALNFGVLSEDGNFLIVWQYKSRQYNVIQLNYQ